MWPACATVIGAVVLTLISYRSLELGILLTVASVALAMYWEERGEAEPRASCQRPRREDVRKGARDGLDPRTTPLGRNTRSSRAARMAANTPKDSPKKPRPIVREALVQRVPLKALVPEHPTENVLDACMLEQQQKRSQALDPRHYYTTALPNAIRAAAKELTTADPAIVPLTGPEMCARSLGRV